MKENLLIIYRMFFTGICVFIFFNSFAQDIEVKKFEPLEKDQTDYEVYTKGHLEMGGFAMLMERVEYVGKEIIYSD